MTVSTLPEMDRVARVEAEGIHREGTLKASPSEIHQTAAEPSNRRLEDKTTTRTTASKAWL